MDGQQFIQQNYLQDIELLAINAIKCHLVKFFFHKSFYISLLLKENNIVLKWHHNRALLMVMNRKIVWKIFQITTFFFFTKFKLQS